MPEENQIYTQEELDQLIQDTSKVLPLEQIQSALDDLHDSEISSLLERLPRPERMELWAVVSPKRRGEVLIEVGEGVRAFLIENTSADDLAEAASHLDSDDRAELIRYLPSELAQSIISQLDLRQQREVSQVLTYDEDQAGSLMGLELLKVNPDESIKTVIRRFRKNKELTRANDMVFVTDESNILVGSLPIKELILTESEQPISEAMDATPVSVVADDPVNDAVRAIRSRDLSALPVVNAEGVLLGQISVDNIVDIIEDKSSQFAVNSVGALTKDEDLFLPVWQSTGQRALWLGINLITAFMASAVVDVFGLTIEKAVGLAVLMPIVASMGGIAGSQTMVLVIRGLALDLVNQNNISRLVNKEILVGVVNGVIWSIIIAILVYIWMGELWLTLIIMLALLVNILIGTFSGVLLPLGLRKIGADPAISAHVILTTITDVVGLGVFLGAASFYLLSL